MIGKTKADWKSSHILRLSGLVYPPTYRLMTIDHVHTCKNAHTPALSHSSRAACSWKLFTDDSREDALCYYRESQGGLLYNLSVILKVGHEDGEWFI